MSIQQTFINDFGHSNEFIGNLAIGNLTNGGIPSYLSEFTGINNTTLLQTFALLKIAYQNSKFFLFYIIYSE